MRFFFAYRFDLKTQAWSDLPSMIHKRKLFVLASLHNKLFAIGGYSETGKLLNSVEAYDVCRNKWQMMAPMNRKRCSHGFAIHKNCIYAIGGYEIDTIEFYEPFINKWFMVNYVLC